ncbi:MAG: hypothetical protein KDA24_17590, partial [Deltaproteobacteria bacterium]|nr:hypothetical protein [Deltaproteobacteria bacterium]
MDHSNPLALLLALIAFALPQLASAQDADPSEELDDASSSESPALDLRTSEPSEEDLAAARRAYQGGVARAVGGAALTGGALALIPAITEYNLDYNKEPDIAFLASTMPLLLTAGIPLLVSGIGHHSSTRHLPYEQRGAAMRARLSRGLTIPWTLAGAAMGTAALAYFVDLSGEGYNSTPALMATVAGWSMVGGAAVMAIDGDLAMATLNSPRGQRDNFARFSVPMLVMGSVTLFVVAPVARTGQEMSREVPQAIVS